MTRTLIACAILLMCSTARADPHDLVPIPRITCVKAVADAPTVCLQYYMQRWVAELPWQEAPSPQDALKRADRLVPLRAQISEAAPK